MSTSSSLSSTLLFLFGNNSSTSNCVNFYSNNYLRKSAVSYRHATCTILNSSLVNKVKLSFKTQNSSCLCDSKCCKEFDLNLCCCKQKLSNLLSSKQHLLPILPLQSSPTFLTTNALKFNLTKTGQRSSSNYYMPPARLALPNNHQKSGGSGATNGSLFLLNSNSYNRYLTARDGIFNYSDNGVNDCNNENYDDDRVSKLFNYFF